MAVLHVLQLELRPVEVRTDSAYVYDGLTKYLPTWRRRAWATQRGLMRNADLWKQVDALVLSRPSGDFMVTKVKGHATMADIRDGCTTHVNKMGNDEADALGMRVRFNGYACWREYDMEVESRMA